MKFDLLKVVKIIFVSVCLVYIYYESFMKTVLAYLTTYVRRKYLATYT